MEMPKTATKITVDELAESLPEVLERVREHGERFEIEAEGRIVAVLDVPPPPPKRITWGEFLELWPTLPKPDEDYWKDLEAIHNSQGILPPPPAWP
jgi:antitoxin (DNA-binding transcriptional repressor) of toxin-antitoxin stability system